MQLKPYLAQYGLRYGQITLQKGVRPVNRPEPGVQCEDAKLRID
jgi:hypothetical protein